MFEKIYGFSCVENHVLNILQCRGMDISPVYYNCAMPLKELFYFIVCKGEKQEYFDRVPRIQDELKKLGIIHLSLNKQENMTTVRHAIRNCKENEHVLIKVTPEFTKNTLYARGYREDHFVLVRAIDNNFEILNDIPEKTVTLTARHLTRIYANEYFKLTIARKLTKQDVDSLWKNRKFKPEKHIPFYFYENDFDCVENLGIRLRNMAGVYKILRYRLFEYYCTCFEPEVKHQIISDIERYYTLLEYYNLKRNTSFTKYYALFCELNKTEITIMNNLKKRLMEGFVC